MCSFNEQILIFVLVFVVTCCEEVESERGVDLGRADVSRVGRVVDAYKIAGA